MTLREEIVCIENVLRQLINEKNSCLPNFPKQTRVLIKRVIYDLLY